MNALTMKRVLTAGALVFTTAATSTEKGCTEAEGTRYNMQVEADNFQIRRRVAAINTRTDKPLFVVEGLISITDDEDGDLNIMIKTGYDTYKLYYAHLSEDVTYTVIPVEDTVVEPYAHYISYWPPVDVLTHGLFDFVEAGTSGE